MSRDRNCEKLQPDVTGVNVGGSASTATVDGLNDDNFHIEEGVEIVWSNVCTNSLK